MYIKGMKQAIFNIGKISIWFGSLPSLKQTLIPRFSYFNGGCYWKLSMYWSKYLLEFSGQKKDNTVYKHITYKELDKIFKELE